MKSLLLFVIAVGVGIGLAWPGARPSQVTAAAIPPDEPRETILEGIRSIATSFEAALTSAGVEPIQSVGEEFNPELHEAVDTEETDAEMDGRVIAEYSRGFHMGDRLLRPARVKVGRASGQARQATENTD